MWIDIFEHSSGRVRLIAKAGVLHRITKYSWTQMAKREWSFSVSKEEVEKSGYVFQRI